MNTYTVTHADGTTSTRTSASRTYTHAIEIVWDAAAERANHQRALDSAYNDAYKAKHAAALAAVTDDHMRYGILTWCGRADLADKALASNDQQWYVRTYGAQVRIVEVQAHVGRSAAQALRDLQAGTKAAKGNRWGAPTTDTTPAPVAAPVDTTTVGLMTCTGTCGATKAATSFPTTATGGRGTECRACRNARRAAAKA